MTDKELKESLEQIQAGLPVPQARWLRSKAELHGTTVPAEIRRCVHMAMTVENLVGPINDGNRRECMQSPPVGSAANLRWRGSRRK